MINKRKENISGYLFASPWIFGLVFFALGPFVFSLLLTVMSWDLISLPQFVGFNNLIEAFNENFFWRATVNTFYYTLSVPIGVGVSLVLAVLLNQKLPGMTLFRTIYFLPSIIPAVANTVVWVWLLHPQNGIVNTIINKLTGLTGPGWLSDPKLVIPSLIIISVWSGMGYNSIIFLAGLNSIPKNIYDAARIDGASKFRIFWNITVPLISPTTFFISITSLIWSFQVFDLTYIATNGRADDSSITLVYYIYQNAFQYFNIGKASVAAWFLAFIILIFVVIQLKFEKKYVHYQ